MLNIAWVKCDCGNFWCHIHNKHVHDCICPPIEEWDIDPYSTPAINPKKETRWPILPGLHVNNNGWPQ